jgi:hypothetical protein
MREAGRTRRRTRPPRATEAACEIPGHDGIETHDGEAPPVLVDPAGLGTLDDVAEDQSILLDHAQI